MSEEKKSISRSLYFPLFFIFIMWLVKAIEVYFEIRFVNYGILPRTAEGLKGILFSPFLHGDWIHLINNSLPILILGAVLFYFYRPIALKVFFLIYFIGNFWLWAMGREAYHIGASGIIYGLATFIFFSGIFRKHLQLMVLSLLVVFLYGGLVWGILPINIKISFEGHLTGSLAGLILAFYYRGEGPQPKKYHWEEEKEEEEEENPYWQVPLEEEKTEEKEAEKKDHFDFEIKYHFKEEKKE